MKGIDISKWQQNVDYSKLKSQGIDFAISTKWLVDLGRSKALVRRLYSHIAKHVKFKGVSLHP